MSDTTDPFIPTLPGADLSLAPVAEPVTGQIVSNDSCLKGKSASFVRHTAIDIGGTPLEGRCQVGQAFGVLVPGVDERGKPHKVRLYSIASPNDGDDGAGCVISTTTKRTIDERYPQRKGDDPEDHSLFLGVCSNYMCDLRPGDPIKVTGPNGKRFLLPVARENHDYLFVATGTGIAPFRGMVLELLQRKPVSSQIHLVMGTPYSSDLIYDNLFTELAAEHSNFHYHTAISRESRPDGSRGQYVHHLVAERMDEFGPVLANPRNLLYICGLAGMQSGLFQAMAQNDLGDGYFTLKGKLADQDPADWNLRDVRRGVRVAPRCMVEVY